MSIAKPFTFVANTYAKASEVNADFDVVYAQVNTNISNIAQNATDIDNLENNKANINGSSSQRFAVDDPITSADAINKQTLFKSLGNSLDLISGLVITKDSGSPNNTIIVYPGSCYDSTKNVVLSLSTSATNKNTNIAANATYYVYLEGNDTGSSVNVLVSTSSPVPPLDDGYTKYRQIGYYTTDSSSHISTVGYYGVDSSTDRSAGGIMNSISPDWAKKSSKKTVNTTYTATEGGYIAFEGNRHTSGSGDYGQLVELSINNSVVQRQVTAVAGSQCYTQLSFLVPIAKGNKYKVVYGTTIAGETVVSNLTPTIYSFVPCKGGN